MDWLSDKFTIDSNIRITGLTQELDVIYILNTFRNSSDNVLVVTNSLYECNRVFSLLSTYTNDVLLFPMDDFLSSIAIAASPDLKVKRLETLKFIPDAKHIIVTNLMGYLKFLPYLGLGKQNLSLKVNASIGRDTIIETLENYGYTRDSIVTSTGTYAVRGFILDVFLIEEEHPIRIEFFGDSIESIRYFDENSQMSLSSISNIVIYPFNEIISDEKSSLLDYLDNPYLFYLDYQQIEVGYTKLCEDILEYKKENDISSDIKYMYNLEDFNPKKVIYLDKLNNYDYSKIPVKGYTSMEIENFNSNFNLLLEKVNMWLSNNKTIIFYLSRDSQIKQIQEMISNSVISNGTIVDNLVNIVHKKINKGFVFENYVVISEFDIENMDNSQIKYHNTLKIGKKINSLNNLNLGDYVVHRSHGIGIYNGVVTLNQRGLKKDYIQINYFGTDKVYIPVEKISSIYKYSDSDGVKPMVNKLNSTSWEIKKRQVQKKIKDISEELMKLYAVRSHTKGEKYQDYPMEDLFALEFPYVETRDQTKAIEDVLNDLRSEVPMDRLLCGDVGFGKTEVAFRGIFKTILNNRQVLYLCPTTILSKQQYASAKKRFASYPIEIALLNRFTSQKETKRILKDLEDGKIDLLFGTHRLLSDDIKCKQLGLLVVDEEQRFGVTHKEKIKKLKNNVNVLTLSATPIPRTLKMAMSGLRDLSIIDTAPVNRYPVQTYVISENDLIVKDAIYKELARKGQIFILYNKVASIDEFCNQLKKLIPEARINYAHGKMTKKELDDIMDSFVNYEFDILVCTTIIETGIDIPNANTLIIYDADHFGLSQLYQLRGRVGRSDKIAYAYLLYNKSKVLNDIAVKRLQTIKDFTELGSGYKIAMRDLSLRGAGDILGSEQAGFVDSVGISLYMKMVDEEIKKLSGEEVIEEDTDAKSLVNVSTHISDDYVSDEDIKIEIHQLINEVKDYDSLVNIKNILEDRFGKITPDMEVYMYEEWFEKLAKRLEITKVKQTERMVELEIPAKYSALVKGDKLFLEAYSINPGFLFKYLNKEIIITLPIKQNDKHFLYYLVPLLEKL
jgi:transcription-repair coupling factor (superfamily II helicase)